MGDATATTFAEWMVTGFVSLCATGLPASQTQT